MQSLRIRSVLALAACIVTSISLTPITHAAGESITIAQMSRTDVVGTWTLHMPNGATVSSSDTNADAHMYTLKNPALGTYTLTFEPPHGARTTVDFLKGTDTVSSSSNLQTTFTVSVGDTLRLTAQYSFDGSIRIQSTPTGAEFVITGPSDIMLKGTTPAQFSDLPPFTYTAYFEAKPGCSLVRPQKRELETPGTLIFNGTYICETAPPVKKEPTQPVILKDPVQKVKMQAVRHLEVDNLISQREVLPNGDIMITLRIHNPSSSVIHTIEITEMFDPSELTFRGDLPRSPKKSPGKLTWNLSDMQPDETWQVTLTAHVQDQLTSGTQIDVTATARSTDLVRPAGEIATVVVITNGNMPETGSAFDMLFIVLSSLSALVVTGRMRRA